MKLTNEQYNEFKEKIASEIVEAVNGDAVEGLPVEGPAPMQDVADALTEEQIEAIIAAKQREIMERQMMEEQMMQEQMMAEQAPVEEVPAEGEELTDEELAQLAELEQKAAATYEYALRKIAASEEMFIAGELQKQACIELLAENGLLTEEGALCKEAAEQSEEHIAFTNKVADSFNDALEKMAGAEDCYGESVIELKAAMEILTDLGYTFE